MGRLTSKRVRRLCLTLVAIACLGCGRPRAPEVVDGRAGRPTGNELVMPPTIEPDEPDIDFNCISAVGHCREIEARRKLRLEQEEARRFRMAAYEGLLDRLRRTLDEADNFAQTGLRTVPELTPGDADDVGPHRLIIEARFLYDGGKREPPGRNAIVQVFRQIAELAKEAKAAKDQAAVPELGAELALELDDTKLVTHVPLELAKKHLDRPSSNGTAVLALVRTTKDLPRQIVKEWIDPIPRGYLVERPAPGTFLIKPNLPTVTHDLQLPGQEFCSGLRTEVRIAKTPEDIARTYALRQKEVSP